MSKMALRGQETRPPAWPEAVKIVTRRKALCQNYCRLVGQLRTQRRATAAYWLDPSLCSQESISAGGRELRTQLGRYLRTLAELRGAVDVVFPPRKTGTGNRRTLVRSC